MGGEHAASHARRTAPSAPERRVVSARSHAFDLQTRAGNAAVTQLVQGGAVALHQGWPAIQRQLLDDVSIDSPDFWTHLRSRTYTRLVAWIGDSRQKLNQFVADMGESPSASRWGDVLQGWMGTLGTGGDIVNALAISLGAVRSDLDPPMTLSAFRTAAEANFDRLSVQVNNPRSELPIYRLLGRAESTAPAAAEAGRTHRTAFKGELDKALGQLPSPTELHRSLVRGWVMKAPASSKTSGAISYATGYAVSEYNYSRYGRDITDYEVVEDQPGDSATLVGVHHAEQAVKALRNAYGADFPLHKLRLPMVVRFWAVKKRWQGLAGPETVTKAGVKRRNIGAYRYAEGTWVPVEGLGDMERHEVFSDWLAKGKKPTVGTLKH